MDTEVRIGSVVLSKSGRDKDGWFMVVKLLGEGYVALADGKIRKIAAPKKKKLKHVQVTPDVLEVIGKKLSDGKKVFDSELASALRIYNKKEI